MNLRSGIISLFVILLGASDLTYGEGTKQIMPASNDKGFVVINKYRSDFGFYDSPVEYRINLTIANLAERIRFGFGDVFENDTSVIPTDIQFRVKDPSDNIIYGPYHIPTAGYPGYIDTYDKAVKGPVPGGYSYIELTPDRTGDYYIEFYYPSGSYGYTDDDQHAFRFFDMSVIDPTGNQVPGRLWSKAWQFWCLDVENPPSDHRFWGTMMILSDDSIVTKVNTNGMIGGTFSIASNSTGCFNTGNITLDRESTNGINILPVYKIFLNDPDSLLFPTARVNTGIVPPVTITPDCSTGGVDFGIKVIKDGTVEILIELNPSPGEDPEDVKITVNVKANPGPGGINLVHWNGNDNHGNPVPNGKVLLATITYLNGVTNLPLYDIEYNDNGFIVSQVRPTGSQIKIFWDDSQLYGGTVDTIDGCLTGTGCHIWDISLGDINTINSWWYVKKDQIPSIPFTEKRSPGRPGNITGDTLFCNFTGTLQYSIPGITNAESYIWSYSGSGVVITAGDTVANLLFSDSATSGYLTVRGHNLLCGDGAASRIRITIDSVISVNLNVEPEVCQSSPEFNLSGGTPSGGHYFVDGILTDTFNPAHDSLGPHRIKYLFSSTGGCSGSDSVLIVVKDCSEIPVFFPNAFTPNGDGKNDLFRPAQITFTSFRLYVYNRFGEVICITEDASKGWDGTFKGELCPAGVYTWIATFEVPEQPGVKRTEKGTVMVVR
jgi:gliding motility-associated-like protein